MVSNLPIRRITEIIENNMDQVPATVAGLIIEEYRPYPQKLDFGWATWIALMILKQRLKQWPAPLIAERIYKRIYGDEYAVPWDGK